MIFEAIIFLFLFLVTNLVSIVLAPIGLLINTVLPDLSSSMSTISNFFSSLSPTLSYAISWTLLSPQVIAVVLSFYTATLGFMFISYTIRQFPKWIQLFKLW